MRMKARFLAATLAILFALSGIAAPASAQQNETLTDQAKMEQIIHDYLLAHPEVILESVEKYQKQQEQASAQKQSQALVDRREELLHAAADPVIGNPNGDVTIVEFFDYRCPYCKQVEPALEALLGEDRQLRLVYKEFPVLGADSVTASKAALAAKKQGKYDAFHRAMMTLKGQINEAAVFKTAESVGLDVERLKRDIASPEVARALKANSDLAKALDIGGTPAFVIGEEIVPGAIDLASLKQMIATARKK
jgi:protein-disulfide isomerase